MTKRVRAFWGLVVESMAVTISVASPFNRPPLLVSPLTSPPGVPVSSPSPSLLLSASGRDVFSTWRHKRGSVLAYSLNSAMDDTPTACTSESSRRNLSAQPYVAMSTSSVLIHGFLHSKEAMPL